VKPWGGPRGGGTAVVVTGVGFDVRDNNYRCVFSRPYDRDNRLHVSNVF
jgi:hypothetical protein